MGIEALGDGTYHLLKSEGDCFITHFMMYLILGVWNGMYL